MVEDRSYETRVGAWMDHARSSGIVPAWPCAGGPAEPQARTCKDSVLSGDVMEQTGKATEARDDVLATLAHDLRGPLNVIQLTLASMAVSHRVASSKDLENLQRSAQRMDRLLTDLLDMARIHAGRLLVEPQPVHVATFVDEAIQAQLPLAQSRQLQLESALPDALPEVFVDASRVQQVFANLIGNAIKFTPSGGAVTVHAERIDLNVQFSVRDTGPGIPAAELPYLFDSFWQARRTARQGTGLGLSISRAIVLAHGGRIWVDSQVGVGSTFYFTVPVH